MDQLVKSQRKVDCRTPEHDLEAIFDFFERLRDKNAVLQEVHVQDAPALGPGEFRELPPLKQRRPRARRREGFGRARRHTRIAGRDRVKRRLRPGAADAVPQVVAGLLPAVADGCAAVVRRPPRPDLW